MSEFFYQNIMGIEMIAVQPSWQSNMFLKFDDITYYDFVEMVLNANVFHLSAVMEDEAGLGSCWHHFMISEVKAIFKLIELDAVEEYVLNVQSKFREIKSDADFTMKLVKSITQCESVESGGIFYLVTCDDESSFLTPYFNPDNDGELIVRDVRYSHVEKN